MSSTPEKLQPDQVRSASLHHRGRERGYKAFPDAREPAVSTGHGLDLFDGLIILVAVVIFVLCGSLIFSKDFRSKGSNAGSTVSKS